MPGLDLKICTLKKAPLGSAPLPMIPMISNCRHGPRFQSHLEYPVLMALGSLVLLTLLLGCLAVEAELLHSHPHGGYTVISRGLRPAYETHVNSIISHLLMMLVADTCRYMASNSASHWTYCILPPNPTCQEADRKPVLQPQKSRQHVRPTS